MTTGNSDGDTDKHALVMEDDAGPADHKVTRGRLTHADKTILACQSVEPPVTKVEVPPVVLYRDDSTRIHGVSCLYRYVCHRQAI